MRCSRSAGAQCSVLIVIVFVILYRINLFEHDVDTQLVPGIPRALPKSPTTAGYKIFSDHRPSRNASAAHYLVNNSKALSALSPSAFLPSNAGNTKKNSSAKEKEKANCDYLQFLSQLTPVPCIELLATMAEKHFSKLGRAIEIVGNGSRGDGEPWKQAWTGELVRVEEVPFEGVPDGSASRFRVVGKHNTSDVADPQLEDLFPDEHFDWLFLNTRTLRSDVRALLDVWWPKVRPLGVLSGDLYSDITDTPYVPLSRFGKTYGFVNRSVMHALHEFVAKEGVVLHTTWMMRNKKSKCRQKVPAWYIVKHPDVRLLQKRDSTASDSNRSCSLHIRQLSRIPPLPCRDDFRHIVQSDFNVLGRAAEVGVFQGHFANMNLKVWKGEYYAIDAWRWRPKDLLDKNFQDDETNDMNFRFARSKLKPHNKTGRVFQIRATSAEAVILFKDEHFDWIYIDALHTFEATYKDMSLWWPKLRPGGFLAGDDYGDEFDTEYILAEDWRAVYGYDAKQYFWGVIRAVLKFSRDKKVVPHVTWMMSTPSSQCYKYPAWYIIKPQSKM